MRRMTRWSVLFSVCLAAAASVGVARAADDKSTEATILRKKVEVDMYNNLRDVINRGANLYNTGDWNGCYRLWEGALMAVKPLLDKRTKLQEAIETGINNAQQEPMLYRRAFVLRAPLDQIRDAIVTDYPELRRKTEGGSGPKTKRPDDGDKRPVDAPKPKKTIWDRLGGREGATQIIDDFANGVVNDPKVDFFRNGKYKPTAEEVAKMKRELVEQLSGATGGPLKYTGPDMKTVHKGMGITDAQFNAAAGHLKKALEKNRVREEDAEKILEAVGSYRKQIVEPKKPEDKKPTDKKPEDKKPTDKKPEDKKPAGTASISGKVSYKGQPVTSGTILFESKERVTTTNITKDGTYSLTRALDPGEYKVAVDSRPVAVRLPGAKLAPEGKQPKEAPKIVVIPAKYRDATTTPLTVRVQTGEQNHDFNLE